MGRKNWRDEDEEEAKPEKVVEPVEPSGKELTLRRKQVEDTRRKMQGVADEITRLLQDEQRRQAKYHKEDDRAAGN